MLIYLLYFKWLGASTFGGRRAEKFENRRASPIILDQTGLKSARSSGKSVKLAALITRFTRYAIQSDSQLCEKRIVHSRRECVQTQRTRIDLDQWFSNFSAR